MYCPRPSVTDTPLAFAVRTQDVRRTREKTGMICTAGLQGIKVRSTRHLRLKTAKNGLQGCSRGVAMQVISQAGPCVANYILDSEAKSGQDTGSFGAHVSLL